MENIPKPEPVLKEILFLSDSYSLKGTLHMPCAYKPPVVIGSPIKG